MGVRTATVYRLCERGELPHVRVVNSIRVRRADLDTLVAGLTTGAQKAGRQRPSAE
jgi:excisionase family DNA binding protein